MQDEHAPVEEPEAAALRDAEPRPLQRRDLVRRAAPFFVVGLVALFSVVVPHGGVMSTAGAVTSAVLLAAAALAELYLPWQRLPRWVSVLVPFLLLGSFAALTAATSTTSGVGLVVLTPLLWSALFDGPWETVCVLIATVATEAVLASVQHVGVDSSVRRVVLWSAVGAMIAVATHGLRARLHRSRARALELQRRLDEAALFGERDRIARDLTGAVFQHISAASYEVNSAASQIQRPSTRRHLLSGARELDEAARALRRTIYEKESEAR